MWHVKCTSHDDNAGEHGERDAVGVECMSLVLRARGGGVSSAHTGIYRAMLSLSQVLITPARDQGNPSLAEEWWKSR